MFNICSFLDDNFFNRELDYENEVNKFRTQIKDKLGDKPSSLGMLNSHIHVDNILSGKWKVIVIDAGGTNLRVSKATIEKNGSVNIIEFNKVIMPGVENEVTLDQFYTDIAKQVIPYNDFSDEIGFCFSYPVELLNSHEGKILRMCKEIKAPEIVGSLVCENLNKKILELGGRHKNITLLNDSTATLLAGLAHEPNKYGSFIGFILGTGSNSCYINSGYIYNLESGWYDGLPRGTYDKVLDKKSINPGNYFMEKATSGAYLGTLASIILSDLFENGHLKDKPRIFSTKEINDFLLGENLLCSDQDKPIFEEVIKRVIERSALYVSINLAALVMESNQVGMPICIVADGSTFHNLKDYQNMVEGYLTNYLPEKYKFEIISLENAPVVGAAISAVLN